MATTRSGTGADPGPRPIGIIVGSGVAHWPLATGPEGAVETPYGAPSSALARVVIGGCEVLTLARHGRARTIAPHLVNYRANLWALYAAGVRTCIGVNTVGAIAPGFGPGELAVPDQLIDYTWGRVSTFATDSAPVAHAEFTEPFTPELRGQLAVAAADCGFKARRGVYGVTQGPRLETAAEIDRLARDGFSSFGWTDAPLAHYDEHLHDHDECIWLVAGALSFGAAGRTLALAPGDRLMLPAGTRHTADAGPDGATYLIGQRE